MADINIKRYHVGHSLEQIINRVCDRRQDKQSLWKYHIFIDIPGSHFFGQSHQRPPRLLKGANAEVQFQFQPHHIEADLNHALRSGHIAREKWR